MPLQTVIMAVYFGLAATLFIRIVRPRLKRASEESLEAGREAMEYMLWGFGGIKEIQIRHSQQHFVAGYLRWSKQGIRAFRTNAFLIDLPKYILEILLILGLAVLIISVTASGSGPQLFGTLGLTAAAAFRLLPSITRMVASVVTARSGEPGKELLFDELDRESQHPLHPDSATKERMPFAHAVTLEDVQFSYDGTPAPVLRGLNLTLPYGKSIAIVGGSGAGKTTLANILLGLLNPDSGTIRVDDREVELSDPKWQNNVAIVPQEVYMMDSTLAENIAFDQNLEDIDRERLDRAVEQAQLTDLVQGVFGGLDAKFGERGSRLSGGQKQRIGIARALYRNPRILVLDEATSALDNETERKITDTIKSLHGQMTVVVIAHRLSTVRDADSIALMEEGRVVDEGTFDELVLSSPQFAHLAKLGTLEVGVRDDANS